MGLGRAGRMLHFIDHPRKAHARKQGQQRNAQQCDQASMQGEAQGGHGVSLSSQAGWHKSLSIAKRHRKSHSQDQ